MDDFGDFTDNGYITANIVGRFSNLATTNSELSVLLNDLPFQILFDEKSIFPYYNFTATHAALWLRNDGL